MAIHRITDQTAATTIDEDNDVFTIVDMSDTTQSASGTSKKVTPKVFRGNKSLPSGDFVGDTDTQTLTNKTLTNPKINEDVAITSTSTEINSLDGITGSAVGTSGEQTLSNKTLDEVYLDGQTSFVPRDTHTGMVTFWFDDGPATDYTAIYPLFQAQGEVGALSIVTNIADAGASLTWTQANTMATAGWEITNHTKDHTKLTTLNEAQIRAELTDSQAAFVANGLNPTLLAYPNNSSNELVRRLAREYFVGARGTNGGTINDYALDTFDMASVDMDDWAYLQTYKDYVLQAYRQNKWIIFYGHSSGYSAGDLTDLNTLIDYAQSLGVAIVTPSEALESFKNYLEAGDSLGVNENQIRIDAQTIYPESSTSGGAITVVGGVQVNQYEIEFDSTGSAEIDLVQPIALSLTGSTIMFEFTPSESSVDPYIFKDSVDSNYIRWRGSLGAFYLYEDAGHIASWASLGSIFADNKKVHIAITISSSKATLYINGTSQGESATVFTGNFTFNRITNLLTTLSYRLENIRVWNAALSESQIWEEMYSDYAIVTDDLTNQYKGKHFIGTAGSPTYFSNVKQFNLLLK